MRLPVPLAALALAALALAAAPCAAQVGDLPDLSAVAAQVEDGAAPPPAGPGPARSGLDVPRVAPGEGAVGVVRDVQALAGDDTPPQAFDALAGAMPNLLALLDAQLASVGLEPRDLGVAAGFAFVTLWETALDRTVSQEASLAAARTVARAAGDHWAGPYRALAPADQERAYEALLVGPSLLESLADQLGQAGAAAPVRAAAGASFRAVFGVPPQAVTVGADGRVSGLAAARPLAGAPAAPAPPPALAPRPVSPAASGAAPGAGGAEVYVKYHYGWIASMGGPGFRQDVLVLFPDGTAVDGWPLEPVAAFTADAVRAALPRDEWAWTLGTWRRDGDALTLAFEDETRRLPRTPRGWWDDEDEAPDPTATMDTYFPVVPLGPDALLGPWRTESYLALGAGTSAAVGGSDVTDRVFFGDGRFADVSRGTFSATTGTLYQSGVTILRQTGGEAAGTWALDGLVLTLEADGERSVAPAFRLPHWLDRGARTSVDDVWIGDDLWERPEAD